jgi:hypothetical protein
MIGDALNNRSYFLGEAQRQENSDAQSHIQGVP